MSVPLLSSLFELGAVDEQGLSISYLRLALEAVLATSSFSNGEDPEHILAPL